MSTGDPWFADAQPQAGSGSKDGPHPVGLKRPNAWGFHDMLGNGFEWCQDWYAVKLPGGELVDPSGPDQGDYHVVRGGAWLCSADECTYSARRSSGHDHRTNEGFRIALSR